MQEKITYTDITFSTSFLSFLHEFSELHKENKNYIKENKNLSYKQQISLSSTLCLVIPWSLRLQVFIEKMQMLEEYEDRESWLFLNLNPPLISKLDLMWIFSSDLQFVSVLIVEYHLSNDRIRNSDQHKSCSPGSRLSGSS